MMNMNNDVLEMLDGMCEDIPDESIDDLDALCDELLG